MAKRPETVASRPAPRLCLITPPVADPAAFLTVWRETAAAAPDIAAVVLRLALADERTLINRIKALAPAVQGAGTALLIEEHFGIVARSGADGAHLTTPAGFADAVNALKPDRIAGCGGLHSRHDAMIAAETGADYVMFGEPDSAGRRPAPETIIERIEWWAELFEVPCTAFAGSAGEIGPMAAAGADFVAAGDFIWSAPRGPAAAIREAAARLGTRALA